MLIRKKNTTDGISGLYKDIGKLCIFAAFAYSTFVLIATVLSKNEDDDYQDRLRKAYAGLSPEEY
ncbi:MAG: hypothetical protein LBD46_05730 [Endomicrobium sp.]|jgi:hypothetical protein|nr:hypothetical protein [Endomicrobium sp.]